MGGSGWIYEPRNARQYPRRIHSLGYFVWLLLVFLLLPLCFAPIFFPLILLLLVRPMPAAKTTAATPAAATPAAAAAAQRLVPAAAEHDSVISPNLAHSPDKLCLPVVPLRDVEWRTPIRIPNQHAGSGRQKETTGFDGTLTTGQKRDGI